MKNKDFSPKTRFKKALYLLKPITVIMLLAVFLTLSLKVFANSSFRVENCNLCEQYSEQIGKEINEFIKLDNEPTKAVSTQVTAAINEYRKEIIDLQSHPDVEKKNLENEILLAYSKGNAAGRLAWVYFYNVYTFDTDASADKINAKYEAFKSRIANSTEHTVLSAECEVMLNELNRLIYTERAKNLAASSDSLTSSALISGTVEKFKSVNSPDLFGEGYAVLYNELTGALGLQRVRDALKAECEQVYKLVKPKESFSASPTAALLVYELENAQSVKTMNNSAIDFVCELLAIDEKKPYSAITKKAYLKNVQTAASRATEIQSAAQLYELFTDYALNVKKAEIKDSVYTLFLGNGTPSDENLIALEQSFNCDGGIIDRCNSDSEVDAELINAKSALFAYKHNEILSKPLDELTISDEEIASKALVEYSTLEEKVKLKLLNEINIIAEKYNNILVKKIREYLPNDALYLDFCEIIAKEIQKISRENIEDFYNISTRLPQKAEALANAIREYRAILSTSNYNQYEQNEKDSLLKILSTLSDNLSKINPSDVAIYADEIADAEASAIRALNVTDQSARVRIATRFSKNAEVLSELKSAYEKISLCSEKSEMILQANRAIYKIERLLTSDAILSHSSELKSTITKMEFLEESEKAAFITSITALESKAQNAREAENATVLLEIWKSFSDSLNEIRAEAEAIDLARAITEYLKKASDATKSTVDKLNLLKYISKQKCEEIYNSILQAEANAKKEIPLKTSTQKVIEYYESFLDLLDNFIVLANSEDLNGYKAQLLSELDKYDELRANYSAENYNKISSIKQATSEKLTNAKSKSECDTVIASAHNEIALINDLLDDEKDSALASLLALLDSLKKESPLYSTASFAKIEGLYDEAKIEISKITEIANISLVKQTLSKYISLIKDVRRDSAYTNESAHSINVPSLQYPSDYDYSQGLLGSIHLSGGIVSDADFSITLLETSRNKKIEELIRKSAKNGSLIAYESLSSETLKLLRSAAVGATVDITLSRVTDDARGYGLKMLIPNELCNEKILGLAFVVGDEVEFYPISQTDSLISARLEHLSKYYIIVESTLNVKPLLMALIILLILEFLILIAIIYLRYKRKAVEAPNQSDLPELPYSAIIPFAPILTRIYPANGLPIAILLSFAAIGLGATIVLLIRADVKKTEQEKTTQKQLKGKKDPLLLGEGENSEQKDDTFFCERENEELCFVGSKSKSKANRAEIDLDLINASFKSGETVNLNTLKQKGLVDENTKYIKILTNGSLTKPLIIEANEFSNAAKDILELSGGEAREIK